jgi:hypothetical protein
MRGLPFHPFAPVIGLTVPIQRPIGPPKKYIVLWDVVVSGTTNTSSTPASTASGLMVESFHWLLGFMLQFQRLNKGAILIELNLTSWTSSMWTLLLETASCWVFFCYALILVDRATRYNRVHSLKDLLSDSILSTLHYFKADAGSYACCFHSDCDAKLFGTCIREHLINNDSNIVATTAGCQLANGLVESHWKVMVHMSCAYLTEKQMPHSFWFLLIVHSARMMNAIPGKLHGKLASPFLLVHGVSHDERTWFPLFLLCYFHHDKDGGVVGSHNQVHTMDGIAVG